MKRFASALTKNSYTLGVVFSIVSVGVSLLINLILYPLYWKILTRADFQSWFSIFEFSLLFLLLDIGFSQNFIKKNAGKELAEIELNYHKLRGTLLYVAIAAFGLQLPLFFFILHTTSNIYLLPYALLALSTALTLWSYAETAALRVLLKFNEIATIAIAGNVVFLIIVFAFKSYGIYAISIGGILRVVIIYLCQLGLLAKKIAIKTRMTFEFEGATTSVVMNFSYLLIFALDAVLFTKIYPKAPDIASYMLNRKIYDLIRGFYDAAMNVISIKLAGKKANNSFAIILIGLFIVFGGSFAVSPYVYEYAIGKGIFDWHLSVLLASTGLLAALFRFYQFVFFMNNISRIIGLMFLGVISIKLTCFAVLLFFDGSIQVFYYVQNVLLCILIGLIYIFSKNRQA